MKKSIAVFALLLCAFSMQAHKNPAAKGKQASKKCPQTEVTVNAEKARLEQAYKDDAFRYKTVMEYTRNMIYKPSPKKGGC